MSHDPLPYIALQPSTSSVLADVSNPNGDIATENVWISFYNPSRAREGPSTLHAKITVSEADERGQVQVDVREGAFDLELIDSVQKFRSPSLDETCRAHAFAPYQRSLKVACPSLSIAPTKLSLPCERANSASPSASSSTSEEVPAPAFYAPSNGRDAIECFALSGDRKRIAIGSRDGQCRVIEIVKFDDHGSERLRKGKEVALRGHVGDITSVDFFPSNEVVLTASSDMSLRVFSTTDGTCPRHLKGHTKRVTGTHILHGGPHKGREVVSSSLDGTLKLWDLSTGVNTRTWRLSHPISSLHVISSSNASELSASSNVLDGRFAFCGHPNGTISLVSLSPNESAPESSLVTPITTLKCSSSVHSSVETLSYDAEDRLLAAGSRNGSVTLFRLPECPLEQISVVEIDAVRTWTRTQGSSIRSIQSRRSDDGQLSLFVASSDGLPYQASIVFVDDDNDESTDKVKVEVVGEFVGLNCDPCTGILATPEGTVWTSGGSGDGSIRVYDL
ncbi:hypothetical protein JCM3766R1_005179 [Sporobolomyces carnicolor]